MEKYFKCKVGDLVSVDYMGGTALFKWLGICNWTDGYKYSFLTTDIGEITWTKHDLYVVGAEVINESR
jgi:hypothetical protein